MSSSDPNEQQQQLQESFLQQQEKISALKELVRKSGAAHGSSKSAAQEKVKNIAEILLKSKAKSRQGLNASTYSTESSSRDASFMAQDQSNMLSISQGQFPHQSPAPSFASTPNPTPSKPQAAKMNETPSSYSSNFSTPGSEKIALMRQQLEQNKLRMAQKASSKQHLEQLVSQLKEKFDSTQQCLEDTTELGRSMSDLSNLIQYTPVTRERHKSATDLSTQNFSLERERIKFLENRCRLLEKQLDKEKQHNQRNASANVSSNSNNLEAKVNELELVLQEKQKEFEEKERELREELRKLQNSREITDFEASEENAKLAKENEELKLEIHRLSQDLNSSNVQDDIMLITKENSKLKKDLETLSKQLEVFAAGNQETSACSTESLELLKQIDDLKNQLQSVTSTNESLDLLNENQLLKQETETQLKRIHELNEINDVLETTRCDLTSKCTELQANLIVAQEKLRLSEEKYAQLNDSKNTSHPKDTDSLVKSEMAKQIQELMDEIGEIRSENSKLKESLDEKEKIEINDSSIAEKIANLEACIENQRDDLLKAQELRNKFEEELMEKTIELNVLNANFKVMEEKLESSAKTKPLFSSSSASNQDSNSPELELENQQLKTKLDESNKAMIKLKLKCKQAEKQIEKLKKGSDLHGEVVKLTKEKDQLQQKITELEDEKGQWQLTQMETSQGSNKEEEIKEALNKEWQEKIEALETSLKEKDTLLVTLKQGEQSRVTSELGEIQLEEQVKELNQEVSSLVLDLEYKDKALQAALENIDKIIKEKDDLDKKLERYVNENMELLEKVEKLSKSSSSAESIEIVERLTQQEKQELEEFNNRLGDSTDESPSQKEAVNELTQTEMNPEITDSLNKLREESSELQTKIELFTTERREVLDKMEHLNTENQELLNRIENLQQEKQDMESKLTKHLEQHDQLQHQLKTIQKEKDTLSSQMQEFKSQSQRNQLSQDITSLQQSSEVVAALDNSETLFEKCETSLLKLHGELEAYRKANDKKSKFNVSKKLAKEAENAYSQLTELLQKVKEASNAVETVTVVETVVAVTASNGKALAEYEQLTAQNRELKATIQELRRLYEEARELNEDQTDNRFSHEVTPPAAIKSEEDKENEKKLREAVEQTVIEYESQLTTLQSRVEDLSQDLYEARTGLTEKSDEISQLSEELTGQKKLCEDYRDKENAHEKQKDQLNRVRKELESKVHNYEHEIQILQTLVKEQKQQLIEAYQEHEHEMNLKILEFEHKEQNTSELKKEIEKLKETSALQDSELAQDLQQECDKLRESLKINKNLVQQQVEELSNKQQTIDTLNQQIIELYKTMEDNANKIIEKEDEISYLQELMESNKQELTQLELKHKELLTTNRNLEQLNKQQQQELQEKLEQLSVVPILEKKSLDLEQRNKDQLEKLKKYAANLKKKANQCVEYEQKLNLLTTQPQTPLNSQELEELNIKNGQLQDLLNQTQQNLQQKAQQLEEVVNIKSTLENEILQLKQEVTAKQLALESQQEQQSSGWGDNTELETLQEEFMLIREELTEKYQEIVELRQSLTTAQSVIEKQQQQLSEATNLRAELQADHNQIKKLENDILQTQQKTVDWGVSSDTEFKQEAQQANRMVEKLQNDLITAQHQTSDWGDTSETEQLRLELQNAQISIHKLQTDLLEAQQQSSDWGDSNETEQLRQDLQNAQTTIQKLQADLQSAQQQTSDWGDANETEQLREELLCSQENFELKSREIEELRQSLMAAQEQLTVWGNESSVKNTDYENLTKALADKTAKLEKQETTLDELENELMTLREKEHENSQKLQELTRELEVLKSTPNSSQQHQPLEQKLLEVTEELKAKAIKFEKSKAVIKERNGQIQRLQLKLKDLQEKLTTCPEEEVLSPSTQHQLDASIQQPVRAELEALKEAYGKLNDKYNSEKANFEETTKRLETLHDGIQAKLQEDMSYIETLEQENNKFKNKICRLEECVGCFEERRASMERRVNFMDAQLQSESEEHTKAEDELIYRLNMLSNHDEVIAQRLIDSQSEKEEIEENFRKLQTEYNLMQAQYKKLQKEFIEYKDETSNDYEQELTNLREQISKSEGDMEKQKAVYDGKLAAKATELDELECELSEQLETINAEKRQLMERLERTTDECSAHQNDVLRLQETVNTLEQAKSELERESSWLRMQTENSQQDLYELQELRMQCMQDKTEIENLRHQIESLSSNHESELQALRTQIAELDTLRMQVGQNQTDDQVFIETENKRLTDLLAEKEAVIENYQRQNLQLQMAAAAASTSASNQPDPFSLAFGLQPQTSSTQQIPAHDNNANELERLNQELQDKNNIIYRHQQDLNNLQTEFNAVLEANQEMQRQLNDRQQDVVNRQTLQSVATALTEHQPTDVIPAPPMFFTSEAAIRTPFDDLIQPHSIEQPSNEAMQDQSPTIEDLQRNVSDLEKHAQDLEHKLAGRNQREFEYEERLREFETRYQEREHQLQQTILELQKLQAEYAALQLQQTELLTLQQQQFEFQTLQQQLHDLRNQCEFLEDTLQERDQELNRIKSERLEEEHLKKSMPSLEQQIVPALDATILPTLDMFFGNSSAPEFEVFSIPQQSIQPVEEEIIVPKKSYLCHPKEAPLANPQDNALTTLDLGEDWGDSWGNSEAAAEAEHFAKQTAATTSAQPASLVPREQQLELQMQDLNERLQELQLSLERSEEQKKELHVKSGKLMKKLKEYKVKIDDLQSATTTNDHRKSSSVESNSMFADLDAAIEEELKRQIKSLEERLEEQKKQQDTHNIEKEKLLARIDMLTAGNDRMSDMKERQDMEVQMYQARIRELQEKLTNLDNWGNDEEATTKEPVQASKLEQTPLADQGESNKNTSPNKVKELEQQIADLTLEVQDLVGDRLELQALYEEEKVNSAKSEQTLATLRLKLQNLEDKQTGERSDETYQLNNLKIDLQNSQGSCQNLQTTNEKLSQDLKIQAETLLLSQTNEKRLQQEVDSLQKEVNNLRDTLNNTKQSLIDLDGELSALKEQKEKQIDEASLQERKHSLDIIQLVESQKQALEERNKDLIKENEELRLKQTTQPDLQDLMAENEYLKNTAFNSTSSSSDSTELSALLQERESEILHLKQRINDLMNEDQTEKLVLEILTKNQEIHLLKMQVKHLEDDKHELENNLSLQITKEMQANKDETQTTTEADNARVPVPDPQFELQIQELLADKKQMEEELQVLNNHVLETLHLEEEMKALTLELDTKNIEISELRKTVESIKSANTASNTEPSVDFVALNSQWEAIVEQRCGEIAKMWQEHLAQRERDFKNIEERLQDEIEALQKNQTSNLNIITQPQILSVETTSSSTPASESTTNSGSTSAAASQDGTPLRIRSEDTEANADLIIEKMQAALESQEMEIVTLKEQLAIRSAEYARLAAQYDPFKLHNTSSHSSASPTSETTRRSTAAAISDVPMVAKAELDLAMYMLHQRDMRCEEMTLELVNLLEERDTLQLKLSNTLRQVEAIRAQTGGLQEASPVAGAASLSSTSDNLLNTSVAGSTVGNSDDDLNQKLSQLQTVSHSKDKVIKEEREQRLRQMEMLQQDVAKMPTAAVSELIGSDLSQSNQSPSNVLLNWLWGNKGNGGGPQPGF